MDFQINGETYFVSLGENARRWEVLVSTPHGIRPVPVYEDAEEVEDLALLVEDKDKRFIPN
jgi:hypothetical protein